MKKVSLTVNNWKLAVSSLLGMFLICLMTSCQSGEDKRTTTINFNNLSTKARVTVQDSSDPAGRVEVTVMVDSLERRFYYHFPEGLVEDENTALPVVFVYHGQRSSASGFYRVSGWKEKSEAEGFLAVFPDAFTDEKSTGGKKLTWNNGAQALPYESPVDDIGFFREMVNIIDSLHAIDRSRIYATGIGAGGGMVARLALEAPELLAAIGPVSGLDFASDARPGSEYVVSCLSIQGLEDPLLLWKWTNPKPNANAIMSSGVGDVIKTFTQAFGYNEEYEAKSDQPGQYAIGFQHENGRSNYIFLLVNDLKYAYPGAMDISADRHGPAAKSLNAVDLFWAFFEAHGKTEDVIQ